MDQWTRLRAHARALRLEGDAMRQTAFRVRVLAATVRWQSPAATAFRDRVETRAAAIASGAEALHVAAQLLDRHADAVQEVHEALRRVAADLT